VYVLVCTNVCVNVGGVLRKCVSEQVCACELCVCVCVCVSVCER